MQAEKDRLHLRLCSISKDHELTMWRQLRIQKTTGTGGKAERKAKIRGNWKGEKPKRAWIIREEIRTKKIQGKKVEKFGTRNEANEYENHFRSFRIDCCFRSDFILCTCGKMKFFIIVEIKLCNFYNTEFLMLARDSRILWNFNGPLIFKLFQSLLS
jgi:hypothetical protein